MTAFLTLLGTFLRVLLFPITLLSDVVLDTNISGALSDAADALAIVGTVVPLTAFFAVIAYFLTVETAVLLWKGVNWAIRKIHGIS